MSILKVQDVAKHFGGVKAVDGISFEVEEGEVFTIVGPNGAGKSTIFNLISRFYDLTAGNIEYMDQEISNLRADQIPPLGIGRTFQNIELFDHSTVLQNLLVGVSRHKERRHTKNSTINKTIFLDEVAELPLTTQVRLLRVLETGEFIKVGSSKVIKTDVLIWNTKIFSHFLNGFIH